MALLIASCGRDDSIIGSGGNSAESGPVGSIEAIDALSQITGQLAMGNHMDAEKLIVQYGHTSPEQQVAFMSAAICQPTSLRYLIEEMGFAATARTDEGHTIIYDQTFFDGSPLFRGCAPETRADSVRYLLEMGADPCLGPADKPAESPSRRAGEWGADPAVVAVIDEYSADC